MMPQVQREAVVSAPEDLTTWSVAKKVGFRFVFCYLLLYLGPGAVGSAGLTAVSVATPYSLTWIAIWHKVVPWVGANILHTQANLGEFINGSGDQPYDFVLLLCVLTLAAICTIVWSLLDSKRVNYERLYPWLRLFMRLTVGTAMIGYGAKKIFWAQFPPIPLARLVDPVGQTSPMGLLWTFMGASRLYSFAGGCGEMAGGLLLMVPRFTSAGALLSVAMMSNVLLLNLSYDVPRKIFSIHLVLMCLFLLWPDLRRLGNVLIFNRPTNSVPPEIWLKDKQMNKGVVILQYGFAIAVLLLTAREGYLDQTKAFTHLPAPLRGIWAVDDFVIDGVSRPPLMTDNERWQKVIFDDPDAVTIQPMDGSLQGYLLKMDMDKRTFKVAKPTETYWKDSFTFDVVQPDHLMLEGQLGGQHITANLHRVDLSDESKFILINRGFHWINPFAYRR